MLVFEELDGWPLPSCHRTWNDPSACWHAPCDGCLFLQGSQVILASSLASSNLANFSRSYRGALSLAEIPAWHAAAPVPASAFLPAKRLTLLYQEGVRYPHNKEQIWVFPKGAKSCPSRRWLLRTWQSLAEAPGVFRHHTVWKNRPAQGLASVLAVPSLTTIRPLTFSR